MFLSGFCYKKATYLAFLSHSLISLVPSIATMLNRSFILYLISFAYLATTVSVEGQRPLVTSEAYQKTVSGDSLFQQLETLAKFAIIDGGHSTIAGSVNQNATIYYIKSILDKTGYYDTYLQSMPFKFSDGTAAFSVNGTQYETFWLTYTPGEDAEGHWSTIILGDFPAEMSGSIALLPFGNCSFSDQVALAGAAGAAGADGEMGTGSLFNVTNPLGPYIPTTSITGVDGRALVAALQSGQNLVASLNVQEINEVRWTSNIIATTKSGDQDNIVTAGAQTDSVAAGPGINDDGSGSMGLLELALQLSNLSVNNSVRFYFWTLEEYGHLGSSHYVNTLSNEEREKIALYLNFDMIASPKFGYFVYDRIGSGFPAGSDHIQRNFEGYFTNIGLKSAPVGNNGRGDFAPFLDVGIPNGGLFTGAEQNKTAEQAVWWGGQVNVPYDACYHHACDALDNLNVTAWVNNTKAIAHVLATYATSLEGIPRLRNNTE
ncbi:hypothetical protein D9756_004332 [Leucocoprinus leucothites]|uniref:Peptide hydrolase n=1 Tax=Leucocoprinus leucothites TaxID=201217 RepID=A0A8H5D979_9AGAR|nr:hypothetical protein D9756_004332 [Leucoagaricus leucothites]